MQTWALGDYGRIAELIAGMGKDLVTAAGIRPGHQVLDVGAGTGNAAIPAAEAGAKVTAIDVTPELLDAGRGAAAGLPIDWIEGDATALPFDDDTFDVVLSCIGAMFAADHEAAARELTRVCRPGGLVALANWTPDGNVGRFFGVVSRYRPPPPPDFLPPVRWGDPPYVRALFDGFPVDTEVREVGVAFDGTAAELADLYLAAFPPLIAAQESLDDAGRAAFRRDLHDYYAAENEEPGDGPGRWHYQWLLVRVHP